MTIILDPDKVTSEAATPVIARLAEFAQPSYSMQPYTIVRSSYCRVTVGLLYGYCRVTVGLL